MIITFVGDISLNNRYDKSAEKNKCYFRRLIEFLKQSDFVVGNLECLARGTDFNYNKKPRLHTSTGAIEVLSYLNVSHVSLAHNHVYDTLKDGFKNTVEKLKELDIGYLGASEDNHSFCEPLKISDNGIRVAIINMVTEDTNPSLPKGCPIYVNFFDSKKITNQIHELKKEADYVVCYLHWGGQHEGSYYPQANQPKIARQLIDAGADLIIGHHSHTVQPIEKYKDRFIYYSLGNFCFDDIHSDGVIKYLTPKRKKGLIVNAQFLNEGIVLSHKFISNKDLTITSSSKLTEYSFTLRNKIFMLFRSSLLFYSIISFANAKLRPKFDFIFFDKSSPKEKLTKLIKKLKRK